MLTYVLMEDLLEELKDMMLKFKGSSNQRTIDVQASLKTGTVVIASGD